MKHILFVIVVTISGLFIIKKVKKKEKLKDVFYSVFDFKKSKEFMLWNALGF